MKKRAFVRYSKQGKIVPGSLILTSGSYPQGPSTWKEVPADLCCGSGRTFKFDEISSLPISTPYVQFFCGMGPTLVAGAISGTYATSEELAVGLNEQLGYMGTFGVDGNGYITLNISLEVAEILFNNPVCTGPVVGSINSFAP